MERLFDWHISMTIPSQVEKNIFFYILKPQHEIDITIKRILILRIMHIFFVYADCIHVESNIFEIHNQSNIFMHNFYKNAYFKYFLAE